MLADRSGYRERLPSLRLHAVQVKIDECTDARCYANAVDYFDNAKDFVITEPY